jgi:hypothetical protein
MKTFGRILAPFALLLCFAGAVAADARALTSAENAKLAKTVERLHAAMGARDFDTVVRTIPPRVLHYRAVRGEVTDEQAIKAIADAFAKALTPDAFVSFTVNLPEADRKELSNGIPYLLIPTVTVVVVAGDRIAVRAQTLAMMDESEWYLMRTSNIEQVAILIEAYPEYKGVEFPGESTEILKE